MDPAAATPAQSAPAAGGSFDVDAVRGAFPVLGPEHEGTPVVYLDSGASAQKTFPTMKMLISRSKASLRGKRLVSRASTGAPTATPSA